jgi:hypothetical protein
MVLARKFNEICSRKLSRPIIQAQTYPPTCPAHQSKSQNSKLGKRCCRVSFVGFVSDAAWVILRNLYAKSLPRCFEMRVYAPELKKTRVKKGR